MTCESIFLPQYFLQENLICTARNSVDCSLSENLSRQHTCIVGAHDTGYSSILYTRLEGRQVCIKHILLYHIGIEFMALDSIPFFQRIGSIVFASSTQLGELSTEYYIFGSSITCNFFVDFLWTKYEKVNQKSMPRTGCVDWFTCLVCSELN